VNSAKLSSVRLIRVINVYAREWEIILILYSFDNASQFRFASHFKCLVKFDRFQVFDIHIYIFR